MENGREIARREGLHPTTMNELLRHTLLAPDIIEMLMAAKQPRRLTLMWFPGAPGTDPGVREPSIETRSSY